MVTDWRPNRDHFCKLSVKSILFLFNNFILINVYCVVEMSISSHGAADEYEPPTDFTAGPFVIRRDPPPLKDLINTFSELYLNSDNDNDSDAPPDIPLPPPDDMIPDSRPAEQLSHDLIERITTLEGDVQTCLKQLSQCCSQTEFTKQCRLLEEK